MNASRHLPRPGIAHGDYPQRIAAVDPWWLALADAIGDRLSPRAWWRAGRAARRAGMPAPTTADAGLRERADRAGRRLEAEGFCDRAVDEALAVIATAVRQVSGYGPYPSQHLAARALVQDRMVEMGTGEGKSLAILMAAATAALARVPVHVLTVNDYLAGRDAAFAEPVLAALGLSAGAVLRGTTPDERRAVYARHVVYVTAQEVGFDHLRDRMRAWRGGAGPAAAAPLLRGLCLALVDEVDSILLDHARTPLVLAEEVPAAVSNAQLQAIHAWSASLAAGRDFALDGATRRVTLQPDTVHRLADHLTERQLPIADAREAATLLCQALVARHALRRDVQYVVQAGAVVIIDETTGRTMPDNVWSNGLHPMVCVHEGLASPPHTRICGQITLQTLLGRYCKVGGISGTLRDARWQLVFLYGMTVRRVPPRLPSRARRLGLRVLATRADQLAAVARVVRDMQRIGRAVLVGTDSVAAADALSAHLAAARIDHTVLTARDPEQEAVRVAGAGQPGAVTVSTNVAGRGTHIELHPDVVAAGGLHVVCCTQNGSPRIDRQLFGRAARNGQPGSHETLLCLEDPLFVACLPAWLARASLALQGEQRQLPRGLGRLLAAGLQSLSVWNQFLQSWQALQQARRARADLLRLPHLE